MPEESLSASVSNVGFDAQVIPDVTLSTPDWYYIQGEDRPQDPVRRNSGLGRQRLRFRCTNGPATVTYEIDAQYLVDHDDGEGEGPFRNTRCELGFEFEADVTDAEVMIFNDEDLDVQFIRIRSVPK